jgi:hypothetical protein
MHKRYRAAATTTALLLTATVGLAAGEGGAAQASGSSSDTHGRAAAQLVVKIKTTRSSPRLSQDTLRPGKTVFEVRRGNTGGLIQVLRLKKGYHLKRAAQDFAAAFGKTPDVKAIRRIDRNVVFYGGMETPKKGKTAMWGTDIDKAGKYFVLNFDKNNLSTFRAKGRHQHRGLPHRDGWINPALAKDGVTNIWRIARNNPHKGWMQSTNQAEEPHFVELDHVKKNTTTKDVRDFFANPTGEPPFLAKDQAETDTGVISPGHSFVWRYHLPKGKFIALCFWPSKMDGTPHALMGMWKLTTLH